MELIDTRIMVMEIPVQKLMTKGTFRLKEDYLPIAVDSCVYYHVEHPHLGYYRGTSMSGPII
jgi:hypothetical protein